MKPSQSIQYAAIVAVAGFLIGCNAAGSRLSPPNAAALAARKPGAAIPARGIYILGTCSRCRCIWQCKSGCRNSANWLLVNKSCGMRKGTSLYGLACGRDNNDAKIAMVGLSNGTVQLAKWQSDGYVKVRTLTGLTGTPLGIATDFKGNVWVADSSTTLTEFYPRATLPSQTYTDKNVSMSYVAVDRRDDIYVEGSSRTTGGIEVDELHAGGTFTPIGPAGRMGYTPGGLAVIANDGNTGYVFVNDQGTANGPPAITRWLLKGNGLTKDGSFGYSGFNTALSVDPSGRDTRHVWVAHNLPEGSQFATSSVEYAFPSGAVDAATPKVIDSTEAFGVAVTNAP